MGLYVTALGKWLLVAIVAGMACGVMGTLFHLGVEKATALRGVHGWLLFCLPVAGLAIAWIYRHTQLEGVGTNVVIEAVHLGKAVPFLLPPVIFCCTVLTHLCGGSAGREGAALQMGGGIGHQVGLLFHLDDKDMRIATLCGMSAFFSALFGTPLTAAFFALEVISVGVLYYAGFVPCLVSALVAFGISVAAGVSPTHFTVAAPSVSTVMLVRVAILGLLCALVSILLCEVLHRTEKLLKQTLPNPYLRVVAGGFAVIALTLLLGTTDYNGAGMQVIEAAIGGSARPEAFLLKLLLTAVTIGAGFKGGEVVPTFFIGATFGCAVGAVLGIPPGFAAAVGLIAVFCGAVNCPVASIALSIELFGAEGLLFFAIACAVSYMLSGYRGLYSSQTILYSKLKAEFINIHTREYGDAKK
ncbi:MAG: chloride channel protein [Oscillospiraceae bacterium]